MAIAKKEMEKPTEIKTAKVETPKTEARKPEPVKKAEPAQTAEPEKKAEPAGKVAPAKKAASLEKTEPDKTIEPEKKNASAKETAKETAASKTAAEKKSTTAKKSTTVKKNDIKTNVVVEYDGKQIDSRDIIAAAKKAFTKANKNVVIKTLDIYVQPEENVAYYVVNGKGSEDYRVNL